MKSFREFEVWQCSLDLVEMVYLKLKSFPKEEQYALCDQLRRSVTSIPANIAEGFGRDSHKDFSHFLTMARGSLYEVSTQLEIAVRLGYMNPDGTISTKMDSISKMIQSLQRTLSDSTFPANQAPTTPHQAPTTPHQAPSTNHPAPSTKHQAPSTKHHD